jgi:hypothetical protein
LPESKTLTRRGGTWRRRWWEERLGGGERGGRNGEAKESGE